jgi:hypothetical protein
MMNKQLLSNVKPLLAILLLFTLSACGGGGDDTPTVTPIIDPPVIDPVKEDKTFTISASSIVIKRISNDQVVAVDISEIKSQPMTLKDES